MMIETGDSSFHRRIPSPTLARMNRPRNQIPWNKILAIVLFVALIGYVLARPSLERWWGVSLPSLTESSGTTQPERPTADSAPSQSRPTESDPAERTSRETSPEALPDLAPPKTTRKEPAPPAATNSPSKPDPFTVPTAKKPASSGKAAPPKFELKKLGKGDLESPAGLVYSPGPSGEHRVDHVMRHSKDEPSRPQHGVFNGSRDEILKLLDDAYQLIKQNSRQVNKQSDGNRTEYTVRFDRAIGYEGGRSGMRNNFPKVNRLRLVLEDGKYVVTAYPVK
jgi:hypothetical protein